LSDVFISYSRTDKAFVTRLHEALAQRERDTWVDWEGIPPTAEWLSEIFGAIDASEAFIFVLSPDSVASDVCGKELQHAVDQNKRLVPLVFRDADSARIPQSLSELNWIFIREQDDFTGAIDTLIEALDTDLERVKAHTRLLVRAREWDNRKHHSLLLRSRDLEEAERDFAGGAELEPKPTPLQLRYITASRRHAAKVQRRILASVTVAMFVAITLAIVAWVQRQLSERRAGAAIVRNIATAKPLDALAIAVGEMGQWFSDDVPEVRSSLLSALQTPKEQTSHRREECQRNQEDPPRNCPVASVAVVQNGAVAAALDSQRAPEDFETKLATWDKEGERLEDLVAGAPITLLAGCPSESIILAVSKDGLLHLRDLQTGTDQQVALLGAPSPADSTIATNEVSGEPHTVLGTYGDIPPGRDADAPDFSLGTYGDVPPGPDTDAPDFSLGTYGEVPTGRDTDAPDFSLGTYGDMRPDGPLANEPQPPPVVGCSPSPDDVAAVAFSLDCQRIAVGRRCATQIWARDDKLQLIDTIPEERPPLSIAVDRTGHIVARGYDDGWIHTATASGDGRRFEDMRYQQHPTGRSVDALAMSPDGMSIASADGDVVRLWQGKAGTVRTVGDGFHGHEDQITSLVFDPADGAFVVSGGRDNTIRVWDLAGRSLGEPRRGHDSWIRSIAVAGDGRSIVSGSNDGSVRRWAITRNPTHPPCHKASAKQLAWSDDRKTALVRAWMEGTKTWDLHTMDENCVRKPIAGGKGSPLAALSSNGRFVAFINVTQENGQQIVRWDRTGDTQYPPIPSPGKQLRSMAISPDGESLALGGEERIVTLWNHGTPRDFSQRHALPIVSLAFGPDGRVLASGSEDNTVLLWEVESGAQIGRPLEGHEGWVSTVAISHDKRFVATGSWDRTVRLWDIDGNPMGSPFRGHTDWITHVGFHPERPEIISLGNDQRMGVWQGGDDAEWMRASCLQLDHAAKTDDIYARATSICTRILPL